MYPNGKYAPPLECTIGDLGRRGIVNIAGFWIDCDDQGVHGEIFFMVGYVGIDGSVWWDVEVIGGLPTHAIPDATPCTYRHPAGLAALADVLGLTT